MADQNVIEYPIKTGRNGSARPEPAPDPLPDFREHLPSIIGRNYSKIQTTPFVPDVLSVVQDPLLAKRGLKYIDDMLRDDMVVAGVSAVMSTVLTAPRTVPADDTKEAKAEADWFAGMLEEIPGGILTKLFNQLLALVHGFSVQEIKRGLQTSTNGGRRGWTVCKDLVFRLPHFFEFHPDEETGELLCLTQRDTWGNDTSELPLCDALYYVWDKWADPFRGRSILRPAYEHWYAKQQFLRFANEQGERVVGKLKITQTEEKWTHDVSFKDYAKKVFDNYHFSRGFVVLYGTTVEVVTNEADPQIFLNSVGDHNKAILRAIGVPWLAVEEGQRTGTYALGKVHQDGFLSKLQRLKTDMEELIRESLFRPLCRMNAIPERLCPGVDMSPVLEEDKQQAVTLYLAAAAQVPGFSQPQDVNWLRERIGLPEVDEADAVEGLGNPVQDETAAPAPATAPLAFAEEFSILEAIELFTQENPGPFSVEEFLFAWHEQPRDEIGRWGGHGWARASTIHNKKAQWVRPGEEGKHIRPIGEHPKPAAKVAETLASIKPRTSEHELSPVEKNVLDVNTKRASEPDQVDSFIKEERGTLRLSKEIVKEKIAQANDHNLPEAKRLASAEAAARHQKKADLHEMQIKRYLEIKKKQKKSTHSEEFAEALSSHLVDPVVRLRARLEAILAGATE